MGLWSLIYGKSAGGWSRTLARPSLDGHLSEIVAEVSLDSCSSKMRQVADTDFAQALFNGGSSEIVA